MFHYDYDIFTKPQMSLKQVSAWCCWLWIRCVSAAHFNVKSNKQRIQKHFFYPHLSARTAKDLVFIWCKLFTDQSVNQPSFSTLRALYMREWVGSWERYWRGFSILRFLNVFKLLYSAARTSADKMSKNALYAFKVFLKISRAYITQNP